MFEKVNPSHPDKVADRIAGALVDLAYRVEENPKVAVEVLIGHGNCTVIAETSVPFKFDDVKKIVERISGQSINLNLIVVPQDSHLSNNQKDIIKCGDNGIFKGVPVDPEQIMLSEMAKGIYEEYPYDGKYILDLSKEKNQLVICQSHCIECPSHVKDVFQSNSSYTLNPLGYWTGGIDVDTGATNRKLGSDMADSISGGGLHGKDLSKADVSVNIYAWLKAQETGEEVRLSCAIGDTEIDGRPYEEIVNKARDYIFAMGGFEKFAEWGLI